MLAVHLQILVVIALKTSLLKAECTECCVGDVTKYTQCYQQCFMQCKSCPALLDVSHASVDVARGIVGDVATYTCNTSGATPWPEIRTCQADLTWNGEEPKCTEVRLVDGIVPWIGRIELSVNGVAGTICDDEYEDNVFSADVFCRMLNFTDRYGVPRDGETYGSGTGPIWLDELECNGDESNVLGCPHIGLNQSDCDRSEDSGVACIRNNAVKTLSLVGGRDSSEGRIQILVDGVPGTVCDDEWDTLDAQVVCRMLNFTNHIALSTIRARLFGPGSGEVWLYDIECAGNESSLFDCPAPKFGFHECDDTGAHGETAGVICAESINIQDEVYLINGADSSQGIVVLNVNGYNSTICNKDQATVFDGSPQLQVICRMAGFTGPASVAERWTFDRAGDEFPIWAISINCVGTEQSLADCQLDNWTDGPCAPVDQAAVYCS